MFRASTFSSLQTAREVAVDVEVFPEEDEYQDVTECVQEVSQHGARIQKVLRHHIPSSLYNGGKGCRVSWSVLADVNGETMHYTVYNLDRTHEREAATPVHHGFFLRHARHVPSHAH